MRVRLWQVLLVVDLALAGGVAALWLDEDLDPKNLTWHAPHAIALAPDSMALAKVDAPMNDLPRLSATSERPLFWASRRPPPPPAPEKPAEPQEPDPFADIRLVGLVDAGDDCGVIVLTGGKFKRVQRGEPLGAWVLDGVEGMTARFKGAASGELRNLELKHAVQGTPAGGAEQAMVGDVGGPGKYITPDGRSLSVEDAVAERRARKAALLARGNRKAPGK